MNEKQDDEKPLEDVEEIIEKDLTDGEEIFHIDISNEARGIKVSIDCEDSGDAVFMAGFVISGFRKLGVEAKSKVMP